MSKNRKFGNFENFVFFLKYEKIEIIVVYLKSVSGGNDRRVGRIGFQKSFPRRNLTVPDLI